MEKQLQLRLTTAAVLIALLVMALYFGGALSLGLVGIVYIIINWKFYSLHKGTNAWYKKLILIFLGLCAGLPVWLLKFSPQAWWDSRNPWRDNNNYYTDFGYNYVVAHCWHGDYDCLSQYAMHPGSPLSITIAKVLEIITPFAVILPISLCVVVLCYYCYYFIRRRKAATLAENKGGVEHAILGLFYTGFLGSLMLGAILFL